MEALFTPPPSVLSSGGGGLPSSVVAVLSPEGGGYSSSTLPVWNPLEIWVLAVKVRLGFCSCRLGWKRESADEILEEDEALRL